jgi:hypothetical protein
MNFSNKKIYRQILSGHEQYMLELHWQQQSTKQEGKLSHFHHIQTLKKLAVSSSANINLNIHPPETNRITMSLY